MLAIEEYRKKYGVLKSISGPEGLGYVFSDGKGMHRAPLVSRNPRVLITGNDQDHAVVTSFDRTFLEFLRTLRKELSSIKPDMDANGFSRNGCHTGPDTLACVAGYMMNPMSYTSVENARYRASLGLTERYSDRQRKIARNVWLVLLGEYHATDINVPKLSTSGVRRFTHDTTWKMNYASAIMEPETFERMLKLVDADDTSALATEFEQVYMTYIQTRNQAEKLEKERLVFDLDYARSGGRLGTSFPADKKVVIDGQEYADMSATRARVIHAGPWTINCVLQVVASGAMRSMFSRFPDVFHITTAEQLESMVNGHYVYCGDVKEYDRSMSEDSINVFHGVMAEVWDPRIAKMSERLMKAPYYSRPLEIGGRRGTFVGDPRSWDTDIIAGNRSGHGCTSLLAKGNKVIDDLLVLDSMGLDVLGREETFLNGEAVVRIINNGDDCVVYSKSKELIDLFRIKRADPHSGHYIVTEEVGQVFSGFMLIKQPDSETSYRAARRLFTPFEKMWVPERSAGSRHRMFWPIGFLERIVTSSEYNPLGDEAWRIHKDVYDRIMRPVFGDLLSLVNNALETLPIIANGLTSADREVLEDPERIHYKYLAEEISPDVMARITSKLPWDSFKHIVSTYFHGKVVNERH